MRWEYSIIPVIIPAPTTAPTTAPTIITVEIITNRFQRIPEIIPEIILKIMEIQSQEKKYESIPLVVSDVSPKKEILEK